MIATVMIRLDKIVYDYLFMIPISTLLHYLLIYVLYILNNLYFIMLLNLCSSV